MPWRLVLIRNCGWKPLNGRQCKICKRNLVGNKAWINRNKHRVKYVCQTCFPKIWVEIPSHSFRLMPILKRSMHGIYRCIRTLLRATFLKPRMRACILYTRLKHVTGGLLNAEEDSDKAVDAILANVEKKRNSIGI